MNNMVSDDQGFAGDDAPPPPSSPPPPPPVALHPPMQHFAADSFNFPSKFPNSTFPVLNSQAPASDFINSDPLQLHHSDHPNYVLSTRLLNLNNYYHWRRSVEISLLAKNKLGFVNGEVPRPSDVQADAQWDRCNGMVTSWLLHFVERDIAESVIYCDTAAKVWEQLRVRYSQSSNARIYQIQRELAMISQGNRSISAYFTVLQKLWDEYAIMLASIDESAPFLHKILQYQQIMQFLMGLNDSYNTVRSNVLLLRPLPSLNDVLQILLQEEKEREVYNPTSLAPDASAMIAHRPPYGRGRGNFGGFNAGRGFNNMNKPRPNYFCDHCKIPSHTIQRCYKVNGPPKRIAAQVGDKSLTDDQFNKLVNFLNQSTIADQGTPHALMADIAQGPFSEGSYNAW